MISLKLLRFVQRISTWLHLVALALIVALLASLAASADDIPLASGFWELAARRQASGDVYGDLGGMLVRIPQHFAEFVEYDGDPAIGEPAAKKPMPSSGTRKIRGFGFPVRYPDMRGLDSADMLRDHRASIIGTTQWIRIGITSGEDFPGSGFLDRFTNGRLSNHYLGLSYVKQTAREYGLEVYALAGIDPKTARPFREDRNAKDIFVFRNTSDNVTTFIDCRNVPYASAPCNQYFSLEPAAGVEVRAQYRRGLLSEWRQMQESACKLLVSFRVQPDSIDASTPGVKR